MSSKLRSATGSVLLMALVVGTLALVGLVGMQQMQSTARKNQINQLFELRSVYDTELAAWTMFFNSPAVPILNLPNDTGSLSSGTSSTFNSTTPAGTPFTVDATSPLDSSHSLTSLGAGSLFGSASGTVYCGKTVVGSKGSRELCIDGNAGSATSTACQISPECGGTEICPGDAVTAAAIPITNWTGFHNISSGKRYILQSDIAVAATGWTPGSVKGVIIDGNNHKVTGVSSGSSPLFDSVESLIIKNLTLEGFKVEEHVGVSQGIGILARNAYTSICLDNLKINKFAIEHTNTGNTPTPVLILPTGAIFGILKLPAILDLTATQSDQAKFQNLNITANILGYNRITNYGKKTGGMVGEVGSNVKLSVDSSRLDISGVGNIGYVGGLIGNALDSAQISISNTLVKVGGLSVTADHTTQGTLIGQHAGGLVGHGCLLNISNSSAWGYVKGEQYVGGLVGSISGTGCNSSITDSISRNPVEGVQGYGNGTTMAAGSNNHLSYIGGLVGSLSGSLTITRAKGFGASLGTLPPSQNLGGYMGGAVGQTTSSSNLTIQDFESGPVDGADFVGGVLGKGRATITRASTSGATGTLNVGGIVGAAAGNLTISDSFVAGGVTGGSTGNIGGIVGDASTGKTALNFVYKSQSTTPVTKAGGLIGKYTPLCTSSNAPTAANAYWQSGTAPTTTACNVGTSFTSTQMATASTYSTWSTSIWEAPAVWQNPLVNILTPKTPLLKRAWVGSLPGP